MQPLKHVDILDQITIVVAKGRPTPINKAPLIIQIEAIDKGKNVVWDNKTLETFNRIVAEKAKELSFYDPKTLEYLKEFTGRMVSSLYKNGLIALEDAPESPEDPYAKVRNAIRKS